MGIKVLVVDDSALMRKYIREMLESDSEIEVIAVARDGEDAVNKAKKYEPDVITLDVNMPKMDGITALRILVKEEIAPVIMLSSLTQEDADITLQALEIGAFDCIAKPGGTISLNIKTIKDELIKKVKEAAKKGVIKRIKQKKVIEKFDIKNKIIDKKKAVAIGISTGGPKTLLEVIPYLPEDLPASVFIVQHMPPAFTNSFARRLDEISKIKVVEAKSGLRVKPSLGVLGKGGYHLKVYKNALGNIVVRTPSFPEHLFKPSADIMMESVLSVYGENTIGVLMTGMGDDGADAMVKIKKAGGITIAESEETAIVFGMPKAAIERGGADFVAPSYKIAEYIVKAVYEEL